MQLPYTREDYGRQFNNTETDAYRELNPNMKVPTLIDGDVSIWESHTILRYLVSLHRPALTGATPAERTQVERWMDWNARSTQHALRSGIQGRQEAAERTLRGFRGAERRSESRN